jgi:hypothetical protein
MKINYGKQRAFDACISALQLRPAQIDMLLKHRSPGISLLGGGFNIIWQNWSNF